VEKKNASGVCRDGLRLVKQREACRLEALEKAARIGAEALDRSEFKKFGTFEDLEAYLNDLGDKVIWGAAD
jgi:Arc/MetJ-type ribon-helix-helix transcriptional regulator